MSDMHLNIAADEMLAWKAMSADRTGIQTLIVCFFTGAQVPHYTVPMEREPNFATGALFTMDFFEVYRKAVSINPAIHDGAVMVGREISDAQYRIAGWSYRLFPPAILCNSANNKGSAYNSSLAMSAVSSVDLVCLLSKEKLTRFKNGIALDD